MNNTFQIDPKKASVILTLLILTVVTVFFFVYFKNSSIVKFNKSESNEVFQKTEKPITREEMNKKIMDFKQEVRDKMGTSSIQETTNTLNKSDEEIKKEMDQKLSDFKKKIEEQKTNK